MSDDNGDFSGDDDAPGRRRKPRIYKPRVYTAKEPRPIDAAQLQDLAIGYAARYATTAARLRQYLQRKLRDRVWTPADAPDIEGLVERITALGYVNDRAWAASKQRDLTSRGFGAGRVRGALTAAGVARDDVSLVLDGDGETAENPYTTAVAFARRRRFGPFARDGASHDPARQRREMAAMARAGHCFDVARKVLDAKDEDAVAALIDQL